MSYLRGYAQTIPSTGEIYNDSTLVSIPIEYIKLANQRLIERNYLLEVNAYKDSIIVDYKKYVDIQNAASENYKKQLEECNRINNDLNKRLVRQQKTSMVLGGISAGSIIIITLIALVN